LTPPEATSVAEYDVPWVPPERLVVVMVNGEGATVIDRAWVAVWAVGTEWSVTCTVKLEVPGAFGVPLIPPVDVLSVRPVGRAPDTIDHV
jgi:hypothetical protein